MPARPSVSLEVRVDPRDLARYDKALAKLEGRPLYTRVDKSLLAAGQKIVAPAMRRMAPRSSAQRVKHKALRLTISARSAKRRAGEVAAVTVTPRSPIAHLVILGTAGHSLATTRSGKSRFAAFGDGEVRATTGLEAGPSRPNPFVDRAQQQTEDAVAALVERDVFGLLR